MMPVKFTPSTPAKYVPFDFEGYVSSMNTYFGNYSFFDKWLRYWTELFHKLDEDVKLYIKRFPHTNPVMQRILHYPTARLKNNEVYHFDHITEFGTFHFHFDVEKMNSFKEKLGVPIEVVKGSTLYIDDDTPYIHDKLKDERLPFFVRVFGVEESFVCADGNKRIKARMNNGEQNFRGYVFYPEHAEHIFFGPLDFYFYIFLYEVNLMYAEMMEKSSEKGVLSVTQLHLQANAAR
ncbi:hypothetical protein M1I95_21745 [Rossellomorea marisflavi]|uniref:hypothetical protein n=1 Tax=Rossellomorea marisflavi TaxID=189381 RepID=UPI0027A8879A|nr:hypothetical protein [Rossellomorea marisflavi]UTE72816.1 hypothetical protein M1I95_21745 [Rossellomorea marisflavi]